MPAPASVEYLGYWVRAAQVPQIHHAYVCWVEGELGALQTAAFAATSWPCPECDRPWPLDRPNGVLDSIARTPGIVRKVSDSCRHCGAILHWDCSPVEDRRRLTWIGMYRREADVTGMRPVRWPRQWS